MPVTADYQFELNSVLIGPGTVYGIRLEAMKGFGTVVKAYDVALDRAVGSYAGGDFQGPRTITIPVKIVPATPGDSASAFDAFTALVAAWAPVTADETLTFQLPGLGKSTVQGRPRGVDDTLTGLQFGWIDVLLTFFCPNPTITPA